MMTTDITPAADAARQELIPSTWDVTAAAVYQSAGTVDALVEEVARRAHQAAEGLTVDTASGRAAIKSLAYQVARTKTALDELGRDLVADMKAQTKRVDDERRRIREALDGLKERIREPLTQWEIAEEARQVEIAGRINGLHALTRAASGGSAAILEALTQARAADMRGCDERQTEADAAQARVTATLEEAYIVALAREEAERQAAVEAETKRKAEAEALEAAREAARLAQEEADRVRAEAAEAQRIADEEAARLRAEAKAEQDRLQAEARALQADLFAARSALFATAAAPPAEPPTRTEPREVRRVSDEMLAQLRGYRSVAVAAAVAEIDDWRALDAARR